MSHPTHPATVHFPITLTAITGALDAIYYASKHPATAGVVATTVKTLGLQLTPSAFPILSYYTSLLTVLASLPAVLSGAWELMPVIQRDGLSSKKAQVGVLHALINDISVFGATYNYWTRRNAAGFEPSTANIFISAVLAVPATFFAAYLGGHLVYVYGMGIGRGSSKAKKSN
ncbi:hypothetical protein BDV95DRAFT_487973 [Massariosphaeria phaeospora]|uniref:DUF2231 domain-containing protein n=1 Tax=Massariosphaeria phaeospora TaxID=100035 RepID=A0A7C8MT92_9PLEO|nr:hypothetical protein BDV95DRAFT_487973 [Massariosphaeria phaeospora]